MTHTVAINIHTPPGSGGGGVEQHTLGLVHSLAQSEETDVEFLLVVDDPDPEWLRPYVSDQMQLVTPDEPGAVEEAKRKVTEFAKRVVRPLLTRQDLHTRLRPDPSVPDANGRFAEMGADIVHFPSPPFYQTELPTIFSPHDLQYRHYPEFFQQRTLDRRHAVYPAGCNDSDLVVVPSTFVKRDVVDTFNVDADKVRVVPRGPPTALYDDVSDSQVEHTKTKYDLPYRFAFYPAQTMEHKNHVRLVEAIGALRSEGIRIDLVLTGNRSKYWTEIERAIEQAGIEDQIHSLGFVPESDLVALYRLATFVVFPSLFEGGGFPLIEAWDESTPVACSDTTALGSKARDGALTFDPESVDEIAAAMERLYTNAELRERLIDRGNERREEFSWSQTGEFYRSLYRELASQLPRQSGDGRGNDSNILNAQ